MISRIYLPAVLTIALFGFSAASYADYPLVSHRYAADPTGLEYNGRLYLYCSNDDENGTNGYIMKSLTCFSTDDLKNWTDHGVVFQAPQNASWATYAWAPSVIANQNKLFLYFGNGASGIGVATSSVPAGPFTDAKGSVLINSATPGAYTPNQWYFDPCAFIDDDGQPYLYFGGSNPTNARVIRLNPNLTSISGSAMPVTATNFFEASYLHKRGGTYYFTCSSTPSSGMVILCQTNSNPTNGFVPAGTVLPNPPLNVYNNNHASIFSYQGNWFIAYHNRAVAKQNGLSDADAVYKRSLGLDPVSYNADGSIPPVTATTNGLAQLKNLDPYTRIEAETIARQSGIKTEPCREGGMDVTNVMNGNWIMLRGVDFTSAGATNFTARVASAGPGGNIELYLDSLTGSLIGTCAVPATGGWQTWANTACAVSNSTARGVHNLYLKFTGPTATNLFNFNFWQFQSSPDDSPPVSLVKFEAESGALGSDFAVSNGTSPAYLTITTDFGGNYPGSAARVATYAVTFPTPGTCQLYAHVRVGSGGYNDDSLFYGNGFGVKNPTNSSDWILVNGLAGVGFNNPADTVTGGGTVGSGVWKWVNLSLFAPGPTFSITATNLTQTFQIGARENGLDLDAIAFGLNYYTYTVSDLEAGIDGTPPSAGTCGIHWTNTLQRLDGFGGGVVFLDAGLDPMTSANMDTLYNTNTASQLGLTLLRVRIAPNSAWSNSVSAWSDSVADAQKAAARGAGVLATPWTPPAAMKDNGALTNGSLLPAQYANYAAYLKKYADHMAANGVSLRAISVQNEPDWPATYESCVWNSNQFLNFFRTNASAIGGTPVMMPESLAYNFNCSDPTLNDSVAVTNVDLIGGHLYGAGTILDYTNAHARGKPTWMTEFLVNDQTIDAAIATAEQIHDCLSTGNMSAYIWWKCIGNANGLLNASGVPQKRGYVLAQFSRFVRPGYNRIATTNSGTVLATAYRNTNATAFAIVAINPAGIPLTPTFALADFPAVTSVTPWVTSPDVSLAVQSSLAVSNATFTYTLPGLSVVTFVGRLSSNTPPAFASVGNQTVNAGVTLRITNSATDPEVPAQTLTFALLAAPANAALVPLDATNALFTWRPLLSQADSTNTIRVKVTDSGTPGLSATNSFLVTVNPVSQPVLSSITLDGPLVSLAATGLIGPDYTLLTSTNLADWQAVFTTNPTAMPLTVTVTNRNDPARYYRIQIGP